MKKQSLIATIVLLYLLGTRLMGKKDQYAVGIIGHSSIHIFN